MTRKFMTRIEVSENNIVGENKWNANTLDVDVNIELTLDISYIPNEDITIVWQFMYIGNRVAQRTIVGWYHGEPNSEDTKRYANGNITSYYLD